MKKIIFLFALIIFYSSYSYPQFTLYGVAGLGGKYNGGVMFKYIPSSNTLTKIFDFHMPYEYSSIPYIEIYDSTGYAPMSFLLGKNGLLYGTTNLGGSCVYQSTPAEGVLFSYNPVNGNFLALENFYNPGGGCNDVRRGYNPEGGIFQASDGKIYGTQNSGGSCVGDDGISPTYTHGHCDNITGLKNISKHSSTIDIFPNPFSNNIKIGNLKNDKNYHLIIYNTLGELVFDNENLKPNDNILLINTEYLKPGLYFLSLSSLNNVYCKTIIKE